MAAHDASDASQYKEVRGLTRGLAVLLALNRMAGGLGSVVELARATGLHRTTVKRLLETLKAEGLVEHRDDGTAYALTYEVRRLSEGYVGTDWIDRIAAPAMFAHLKALSWPSDLATPDAGVMVVRESTHRESLLSQHRSTIGTRIPMLTSAIGRAWLAHCAEDEREVTLALLRARGDAQGELARDRRRVSRIVADTRRRGYGLNQGELADEASVVAIAFPIFDGRRALGAINLVLMRDTVSLPEIRNRYVPLLGSLARQISQQITAGDAQSQAQAPPPLPRGARSLRR